MSAMCLPGPRASSLAALASLMALAGTPLRAQPAQPAPAVPSTVAPGSIERQFQTPPQPRSRAEPAPQLQPPARTPGPTDGLRFVAQRIEVDGAQALPPDTLRALVAPWEGRDIGLADLHTLAARITATYRNEGYVLAQVIVPEQRIEPRDAVVRLQAIEGFVDEVRFAGDVGSDLPRLEAVAQAIRATRPITATALERYLLLLNDIPGLRAATTLTPSPTQAGAADLEIRLARRAGAGEVVIDNRGSRAVGPWRATVDLEAFGLTGASRTAAKLVSTGDRQLQFASVQHEQLLGQEGTRLVLGIGATRARPELPASLGALSFETGSRSASLSVQHPLIRSRAQNLYVRLGFTGYDGHTQANEVRTSEERIRAFRLGLTWDRADLLQGLNVVDIELSRGVSGFGASAVDNPNRSRSQGRPDFLKATLYAARLQSLASRWSLLVAATGQYAWTDLLAPELFGVGGENFGRGYEPSELLGDHGAALKLELRYSAAAEGLRLGSYTLYAFYDAGFVRRRTPLNEAVSASLASAGLGIRFGAAHGLSGFVEVAQPLTRPVAARGDRDTRSQAGVAAKF